jgi:hypothetical protein
MSKTRLDDRIGSPNPFRDQGPRPGRFLPHPGVGVTMSADSAKNRLTTPRYDLKPYSQCPSANRDVRRTPDNRNVLWTPEIVAPVASVLPEREWWAWEDLNFRPHAYQARALTN